jgi:hypothetical protein
MRLRGQEQPPHGYCRTSGIYPGKGKVVPEAVNRLHTVKYKNNRTYRTNRLTLGL